MTLSNILVIVTSSSEGLRVKASISVLENLDSVIHTYRPGSYSLEAMGEISEWIVMTPSNGRSGVGFTIFASTLAKTLREKIAFRRLSDS